VTQRARSSFEKPNGIDEVTLDLKVWQEEGTILEELKEYTGLLDDIKFTHSIRKILETMRAGEIARGEI